MSSLARVPCTIVTGFLGSGKTTLIRHVLENANGRRLAVIVNEFGDIGIDGEILKGCGDAACPEENIVELANGCLCCTVADEFVPALDQILARTPAVEHIVIETSGLALPKPLVQGAKLLAGSADGLMPWRGRPDALKRGLIARVPPFDFSEQSE